MPSKGKRPDAGPPPPPEPNPVDELPQEIRELKEPPFKLDWQPVVSLLCFSPEVKAEPLKDTLKRKDLARIHSIHDLMLRLDRDGQLYADLQTAQDAHFDAGGNPEEFVPSAEHAAEILRLRFEHDHEVDWKLEYHRRKTELQVYQDAAKAANGAVEANAAALRDAEAALAAWTAEQEQARLDALAEAEDGGDGVAQEAPPVEEDEDGELSKEEEMYKDASEMLAEAQAAAKEATDMLESNATIMDQPFRYYPVYWVDGLGSSFEEVKAATEAGVPLRMVVWAKTLPAAPSDAPSAEGEAAADAAATAPPAPAAAPELFVALCQASKTAGWDSSLGRMVALEVELPPTPGDGVSADDKKDKKKTPVKGKKDEQVSPESSSPLPPADAPGWDTLSSLFSDVRTHAQAYDAWRAEVRVYDAITPKEDAPLPGSKELPMSLYKELLEDVPAERVSVPMLMHAMLEQVSRNMQGEEVVKEGEALSAQAYALAAIERAFHVFEAAERGEIFSPGVPEVDPRAHFLVQEGDSLAAAASGLTLGYVPPSYMPPATHPHARSPDSTLDGPQGAGGALQSDAAMDAAYSGNDGSQDFSFPQAALEEQAASSPSFLKPGTHSAVDVDAVEAHMLSLVLVPIPISLLPEGAAQAGGELEGEGGPEATLDEDAPLNCAMEEEPVADPPAVNLPPATLHRCRLLKRAMDMLPPSTRVAHGDEILRRNFTEPLPHNLLKQVVQRAQQELPHSKVVPLDDGCKLLACYAGGYSRKDGVGLPMAISFSTYWHKVNRAAMEGEAVKMPEKAYKVVPELQHHVTSGRCVMFQYGSNGLVVSTGGHGHLSLSQGATNTVFSSATGEDMEEASYLLTTTLDSGTTVCASKVKPMPALPPPANTAEEEAAAEKAAEEAAAAAAALAEAAAKEKKGARPPTPPVEAKEPEPAPAPPPPAAPTAPVLAVSVATPTGMSISLTTEGKLTIVQPPKAELHSGGLAEPGAPYLPTYLSLLPDGTIVKGKDGSSDMQILHPDGSVSKRLERAMGWQDPYGNHARGWVRTLPDGTRFSEPDSDSVAPAPPPPPPERPFTTEKGKKTPPSAKKGKTKEEELHPTPPPPPTPLPPFQVDLPAVPCSTRTDPDTGVCILQREDGLQKVTYPSGDALMLYPDGVRLHTSAGGTAEGWSAELGGDLVVRSSGSELTLSPVPGVTLTWSAAFKTITCRLPDGASMLVSQPLALLVPRGHNDISAQLLSMHLGDAPDALALARSNVLMGAAVFDLLSGAAALQSPVRREDIMLDSGEGEGTKPPREPHFILSPGAEKFQEWPHPEPLTWEEIPPPPPPPPPPPEPASDEEREEEEEEDLDDMPPPPMLPPPEPIIHYNPLAPGLPPRVFVICPNGSGYEILSETAVAKFLENSSELPNAVKKVEELGSAPEPGVRVHSVLSQQALDRPGPLPLARGTTSSVHKYDPFLAEMMPSFRRTSTLSQPAVPSDPPGLKDAYMPAVCGHRPPEPPAAEALPVLVYRELLEHPQLSDEEIAAAVLVGLPEDTTQAKMEPSALSAGREERSTAATYAVYATKANAEAAIKKAEAEALEAMAMHAAEIQKQKVPWPPKVGEFDHTPKRPVEGELLRYFNAEEGIVARRTDEFIKEGAVPINRTLLPPRQPPMEHATPGAPSSVPGVYLTDRAKLVAETKAEADMMAEQAEAKMMNDFNIRGYSMSPVNHGSPSMSPMHYSDLGGMPGSAYSTGSGPMSNKLMNTDFNYPELGHSLILANQKNQLANSIRSPVRDVYGQSRATVPPLPRTYRANEAETSMNEQYLKAEGDKLKVGATSSVSLLKLNNKVIRQFVLTPGHLHFGELPLGSVSHRTARLKNVGTGAARYSVDRPALPLRIIQKPGPVAVGMEAILTVEFVAETLGDFVGEVVVRSKLNVLTMTVSAKVIPPAALSEASGGNAASTGLGSRPTSAKTGSPEAKQDVDEGDPPTGILAAE